MPTRSAISKFTVGPRRQRGMIAMIISLVVLVATLLAAIALMRSVDTSNTIAGSLSFRQGVVQEAERAYEDAKANITTVEGGSGGDSADNTGLGYYAEIQTATTRPDIPDLLSASPPTGGVVLAALGTQNTVRYVVERLCKTAGPATVSNCIVPGASVGGGSGGNANNTDQRFRLQGPQAAYRLTVRVDGPKNSLGYVQSVLR